MRLLQGKREGERKMTSSVIITTYNRAGHLRKCLPSLLNQRVRGDEIIIVDDGSQGQTGLVVKQLQEDYPDWNIRYIYNHRPEALSCCLPKNIGIREAKGDVIIFTEPEMLHVTGTIEQHLEEQRKEDRLFLSAGTIYFCFSNVVRSRLTMVHFKNPRLIVEMPGIKEWIPGYEPRAGDMAVQRGVRAVYCASVKRKHLMEVHGFEENMKWWGFEDINLQTRLSMIGVNCECDPEIVCVHIAHSYNECFQWFDISKKLHEQYSKHPIANEGRKWGKIIPRR